ncbi:MAG: superoxide dismutase, partial [bacterium]|nr:superoxide dismutase [bacterium]
MKYEAKNFDHLLGTPGFSDALLKNHFTLYQGYVTNTGKLMELLKGKEPGTPEYNELKRRFGWDWTGMRLHELYFGNM